MIDDEVQAFIDLTMSYYPDDVIDQDIQAQRESYDRMCADFRKPHPPGVHAHDGDFPGPGGPIPVRRYALKGAPNPATVLYFHGGGYVLGGLDSHDDVCAEICAATGCAVVSAAYRLAPEHIHPAQFEDAMAAFGNLAAEGAPVIAAGDSAGGNLSAALCLATRGRPDAPIGQVLIYPALGGDALDLPAYQENSEAPMLTLKETLAYKRIRAGGPPPRDDPTFAPLAASDVSELPPCFAVSADLDPLRDDAKLYVERLSTTGVQAVWRNEPGLIHGYLRARHMSAKAGASFAAICGAISRMARGEPLI